MPTGTCIVPNDQEMTATEVVCVCCGVVKQDCSGDAMDSDDAASDDTQPAGKTLCDSSN